MHYDFIEVPEGGEAITANTDHSLNVPDKPIVPFVEGDGIFFADIDVVVYDFSHSGYIDPSAALAIDEMIDLSIQHGRKVLIAGLRDQALKALSGMGVLDRISADQQFEHRKDAIDAAVDSCRTVGREAH